jgi:hypothetical protein
MNVLVARTTRKSVNLLLGKLACRSMLNEGYFEHPNPKVEEGRFQWVSRKPRATIRAMQLNEDSWEVFFEGALLPEKEHGCLEDFGIAVKHQTLRMESWDKARAIVATIEDALQSSLLTKQDSHRLHGFDQRLGNLVLEAVIQGQCW